VGEWTTYDRHGDVYKVTNMKGEESVKPSTTRAGSNKPAKAGSSKTASRSEPRWKSVTVRTPAGYIALLPADRKAVVKRLREVLRKNLPAGFEETIDYGVIAWVVPLSRFPAGYLSDPKGPPLAWFKPEWPKHTDAKLDLGKICLRLRNLDGIPYDLIGELAGRMTPGQWIAVYEAAQGSR
jgi:hypothetical protein